MVIRSKTLQVILKKEQPFPAMDTTAQTKQIVQQFLHSLSNREITTIKELFAQVVDWYISGNEILAPWLGKRSTKQEVWMFFNNYGSKPNLYPLKLILS